MRSDDFLHALGSPLGRATEHAANGLAINGLRRALDPIERREPVVILSVWIGVVFEEDRDRPHETRLGCIVKRGRPSTVVVLAREALVIRSRAMTKERGDIIRIVFSALISGT